MALDQLLLERLSANTGNLLDDEELIGVCLSHHSNRFLPSGKGPLIPFFRSSHADSGDDAMTTRFLF